MSSTVVQALTGLLAQADTEPAGGAEMGEVILATAIGLVGTVCVLGPIAAYRSGRFPQLGRFADWSGRQVGLPGWAALPLAIQGGALIVAVFGMYWDISLHIDNGRDAGPLANPAHFFILFGLMGVMAAGVMAMALPQKPTRASVKIPGLGWDAPVGAILMAACGAFSLTAFPLDDVWHRIFGQDVTLWSPTHLMLITGASLSTLGGLALYREALEEREEGVDFARAGWLIAPLTGALLIGLNTFVAEFDFGVPQFRLVFHPIGLMLASGVALVTARLIIGPWGALATAAFFIIVRGLLTLLVGPVFGQTVPHLPLYLAEAAAVELVALAFVRSKRPIADAPVTFGALAGIAIGTIGLAAEWGWSHVWVVNPWPESMLAEAAVLGFVMAVAAGSLGGFVGRALTLRGAKLPPAPYWALPLAAIAGVAVVLYALPISKGDGISARVATTEVRGPPDREIEATFTLDPPDAADDNRWFQVTSWQGEDRSIVADVEEVRPGVYRTTEPVPVDGSWKSILRLHKDDQVLGMPVFMPRDEGIPAPEVPALAQFSRGFKLDKENLQREQKGDVSGAVTTISYIAVGALTIVLFAALVWGLRRVRDRLGREQGPPEERGAAAVAPGAPRPAV